MLFVVAVAAACGGDEGDDDPESSPEAAATNDTDDGVDVIMSTFTPTPENNTPAALQTRSAQQTAAAQSPQSDASPTAPPDITVNPNNPLATVPANAVKPPDVTMGTAGGQQTGMIGSMNWFDPDLNAGYNGDTPYVGLPQGSLDWASDTTASFTVPDSPYAVRSTQVNIFVYDDNVAIPQDAQGQVIGSYVFARQADPVQQTAIEGPDIRLEPETEPGNYIVEVTITWDGPPELEAQYNEALFTQYVFVVTII
jgi:hypothetical protein